MFKELRSKLLIRKLKKYVRKRGGELFVNIEDTKHLSSLWYGGNVAEITYKNHSFVISANGDVIGGLYDSNDNEIEYVKDKGNHGIFCEKFYSLIKSDKQLYELESKFLLRLDYNNWWECFLYLPDGSFVDMMMDLEYDRIDEAIIAVADSLDEIIEHYGEL